MKPVVDFRRCFASKTVCTAIKFCPVNAVSYIEVDVPIMDKTLKCNCNEREELGLKPISVKGYGAGCDCVGGCESESKDPLYDCGGTPYGRIIIDYDKVTTLSFAHIEIFFTHKKHSPSMILCKIA